MIDEKSKFFNSNEPIYLERIDGTLAVVHTKPCKREDLFRYAEEASKVINEEIRINHDGQTLFKDGKALIGFGTT